MSTKENIDQLRRQLVDAEARLACCYVPLRTVMCRDALVRRRAFRGRRRVTCGYMPLCTYRTRHPPSPAVTSRYSPSPSITHRYLPFQALALEKEMGMAEDDSSNAASAALVGRLRCQIGEQDRRIRELEPKAEAAA